MIAENPIATRAFIATVVAQREAGQNQVAEMAAQLAVKDATTEMLKRRVAELEARVAELEAAGAPANDAAPQAA